MKESATPQAAAAPAPASYAQVQSDQRPATAAQRQMLDNIDGSPRQVAQRQQRPAVLPARQHAALSSQLPAHAYAQGGGIHVAPGQQQHLPHEAEHGVPQGPDHATSSVPEPAPYVAPTTGPASTTVQRREISQTIKTPTTDTAAISSFIGKLNTAMEQAYRYVLHVPELGMHQNLDGYTARWVELYQDYKKNKPVSLMAAAFGYAIESLTTLVYLPSAPAGMVIELQGPRSGTRPDIILKKGTADLAWIDLTADSPTSRGHIWEKVGWQDISHTAELGYPPMDLSLITPTANYTDDVDLAAFKKREHWIKKQQEIRRILWRNLRPRFTRTGKRLDFVTAVVEYPKRIMQELSDYFGVALDPTSDDDRSIAASVLTVMGVGPKTWQLTNSVSRARGESFLLQHDPHLFTIEIPEDGLPMHLVDEQERAIALRQEAALREQASQAPPSYVGDEPDVDMEEALVPYQEDEEALAHPPLLQTQFTFNLSAVNFQMAQIFGQRLDQFGLRMSVQMSGRRFRTRLNRVSGAQFVRYFGMGLNPTGGTQLLGKRLRDAPPPPPSKRLKTQQTEDENDDVVQVNIQLFPTATTPQFLLQNFQLPPNLFAFLQQPPGPLQLTDNTKQQ